jgi:hypothetical protein
MSAHPGLKYKVKYPDFKMAVHKDSHKKGYQFSKEELSKYVDEKGQVIVSQVARVYKCAPYTVTRACNKWGLKTRSRLAWQEAVLKEASKIFGECITNWTRPDIVSPTTNHVLYYDGFFPEHNLIIEAHGKQHFHFIHNWHRSYDKFEELQAIDEWKVQRARELGYKIRVVRYTDSLEDPSFWTELMDSDLFVQEKTDIKEIVDSLGPFPVIQPSSKTQGEFEKLKTQTFYLDEANTIRKYSLRGTVICSSYFPNRYSARYKGMMSVREAWDDPDMLAKAVKVQVNSGDKIDPGSVLKALVMLCKTPSVFRPGVAKFICDRYAKKGVVFDPCAGYGGRLFGALASGVTYHGIDINPDTVQGNLDLARALGLESKVTLEHSSIEEFVPPSGVADLVFTSPPYYDLERYGHENTYLSAQDWEDRFLRSLVSKAQQVLKSGGVLALNLPAKPVSGYCILDRVMKLALESGFDFLETLYMPIRGVKSGEKVEPIVSFVKSR